ncbi:hypothetical protein BC827DRAFT_729734 [Russula dissimulans]|nr:hypothetical protein BC827DRAFT_729734 [Russula dissimulans]
MLPFFFLEMVELQDSSAQQAHPHRQPRFVSVPSPTNPSAQVFPRVAPSFDRSQKGEHRRLGNERRHTALHHPTRRLAAFLKNTGNRTRRITAAIRQLDSLKPTEWKSLGIEPRGQLTGGKYF